MSNYECSYSEEVEYDTVFIEAESREAAERAFWDMYMNVGLDWAGTVTVNDHRVEITESRTGRC